MRRRTTTSRTQPSTWRARKGFSLVELMVVIMVAMILTGLLLPALNKLRETVNVVVCASSQRQLGMGTAMFASDSDGFLPGTVHLDDDNWKPQELMAAYTPASPQGWDGLGILFQKEYCGAFQCFYCPSHRGSHPLSKYASEWLNPTGQVIQTNVHYAGDRRWDTKMPRFFQNVDSLVLLTDGLRTIPDVNHRFGMNVTYGDMSVRWRADLVTVFDLLPETEAEIAIDADERYQNIWIDLQNTISPDAETYPQ